MFQMFKNHTGKAGAILAAAEFFRSNSWALKVGLAGDVHEPVAIAFWVITGMITYSSAGAAVGYLVGEQLRNNNTSNNTGYISV